MNTNLYRNEALDVIARKVITQAFRRFTDHDELSYEMVRTLIKQVVVTGVNEFNFVWNFKNEYEALCKYTGEVSA